METLGVNDMSKQSSTVTNVTVLQDVEGTGNCVCGVRGGIWELLVLSIQSFCDPKTSLKDKVN